MQLFNKSVFCFIASVCVVTGQALAAVIVDPSNTAFQRTNASALGALAGPGFGDLCRSECGEGLAPDWLANGVSFQFDIDAAFGANVPDRWNLAETVGFRVYKMNADFSVAVSQDGPKAQPENTLVTVLFVDSAYGIEPFYLFVNGQSMAAKAISPASTIPLPSAMSLFLIGLAGLGFLTWRRRGRPSL